MFSRPVASSVGNQITVASSVGNQITVASEHYFFGFQLPFSLYVWLQTGKAPVVWPIQVLVMPLYSSQYVCMCCIALCSSLCN